MAAIGLWEPALPAIGVGAAVGAAHGRDWLVGAGLAGDVGAAHGRNWIHNSEPGEEPGTYCRDTLKTSLCALRLFPTAEGPGNRYPAPHLTL